MEQVLSICNEDPELSNLLKDHPILVKSLESIPNLQAEHIFSILTAVENEVRFNKTYIMSTDMQSGQNDRKSLLDSALEVEEFKLMLVKEQEHNKTLHKVRNIQQIIKLSESFNDLSKTLQERSVSNTSKLMNFVMIERENKDLKEQIYSLTEKLEDLSEELQLRPPSTSKTPESRSTLKAGLTILHTFFKSYSSKQVHSIFSMIKFWIYKRAKIQEELESKVTYK